MAWLLSMPHFSLELLLVLVFFILPYFQLRIYLERDSKGGSATKSNLCLGRTLPLVTAECNIQRSYASAWCPGLVSCGLRCIETSYLAQSMAASASPLGKTEAAHLPGKGCFQGRFFGWEV